MTFKLLVRSNSSHNIQHTMNRRSLDLSNYQEPDLLQQQLQAEEESTLDLSAYDKINCFTEMAVFVRSSVWNVQESEISSMANEEESSEEKCA
jgi:hypothetical protein